MLYIVAALVALIAFFAGIVWLIKLIMDTANPPEKIRQKHENDDHSKSVFMKKYPEANLGGYWWTFFLTGSILSLGLMITAFEWTTYDQVKTNLGDVKAMDEFEVEPPQTQRKQKPPPPPPPPKIEVVDDEEILEEEPEIQDIDVEAEEAVDMPAAPEPEEEPKEDKVFQIVEDMPTFPGGEKKLMQYLAQIKYPPIAKENDIEGTVYVRFVIDKQGNVTNVSVARGADKILNKAALKHVKKMPKWEPGKQRGKTVKVQYVVPIRFRLN